MANSIGSRLVGLNCGSNQAGPLLPDPTVMMAERLSAAEEVVEQVLNCVHPTLDSEEKRRDVIDYVQELIKTYVKCEVVSYGSVPLKTYLPNGDIDLTVLKGPKAEESLVHGVLAVLQAEEQNENAEFEVKETRLIDAEVKVVKCLVRNIVIDISFNQLGGLSTLCFLEQVDRLIGRNHLFKRSIILIKAWCYYESRIHGAQHGLLSTYALEMLILFIFQLFHSSINGPLAALYRFLAYYGQFDWENYGISLKGPFCKSSLPDIVVKLPKSGWTKLLTDDFLQSSTEMFSIPSMGPEVNASIFRPKHFNIIDPLRENNNLGRSVHRGNFYRIQSALKYGARKLAQILSCPKDEISGELNKFFANTHSQHMDQFRSSFRHLALELDDKEYWTASVSSPVELLSEDDLLRKSSVSDFDINNNLEAEPMPILELKPKLDQHSTTQVSSEIASIACSLNTSNASLGYSLPDYDVSSKIYGSSLSENCSCTPRDLALREAALARALDNYETDSTSVEEGSEIFNTLADLTGDYDNHIRNLLCGQLCHLSLLATCNPSSSPSQTQYKEPYDISHETVLPRQNELHQVNSHLQGKQKVKGTGAYLPEMVSYVERPISYYMEGPSIGRDWSWLEGYNNDGFVYGGHGNNFPASEELNYFQYGSRGVQPARSRNQEPRQVGSMQHQSPHSAAGHEDHQLNEYLNSCGIQCGLVGNQREAIAAPTQGGYIQGLRATTTTRPSVVKQSVHLKNEDEFPPLCL